MESFPFHTVTLVLDIIYFVGFCGMLVFVVIGTEDAYEKMFKELRTARRIGEVINGNAYCENCTYFMHMVAALFRYQWFEEPVKLTNEITEALYEISRGIVCF